MTEIVHLNDGLNYMRDNVEIGIVWSEYEIFNVQENCLH